MVTKLDKKDIEYFASCRRLIFDFIVADGYISQREISLLEGVNGFGEKYHMYNDEVVKLSRQISFSQALSNLSYEKDKEKKNDIYETISVITGVGGDSNGLSVKCSPREARMLLAAKMILKDQASFAKEQGKADETKAVVLEVSRNSGIRISKKEIIYVEGKNVDNVEKHYEERITGNYTKYKSLLALYGLDFCSVDYSIANFSNSNKQKEQLDGSINGISLNSILKLLYPNKLITYTNDHLKKITTRKFTHDLLGDNIMLYETLSPSLLLKITDSKVERGKDLEEEVTDVLIIPITKQEVGMGKDPIYEEITKLIEAFSKISNGPFSELTYNGRGFYGVRGFHNTLLTYIVGKINRTIDNISSCEIKYEGKTWSVRLLSSDGKKCLKSFHLAPQPLALYISVLYMSSENKCFVNKSSANKENSKNYEEGCIIFQIIYSKLTDNTGSEGTNSESTFNSMFSKFKKSRDYLSIPEKYKIKINKPDNKEKTVEHWVIENCSKDHYTIHYRNGKTQSLGDFIEEVSPEVEKKLKEKEA